MNCCASVVIASQATFIDERVSQVISLAKTNRPTGLFKEPPSTNVIIHVKNSALYHCAK